MQTVFYVFITALNKEVLRAFGHIYHACPTDTSNLKFGQSFIIHLWYSKMNLWTIPFQCLKRDDTSQEFAEGLRAPNKWTALTLRQPSSQSTACVVVNMILNWYAHLQKGKCLIWLPQARRLTVICWVDSLMIGCPLQQDAKKTIASKTVRTADPILLCWKWSEMNQISKEDSYRKDTSLPPCSLSKRKLNPCCGSSQELEAFNALKD